MNQSHDEPVQSVPTGMAHLARSPPTLSNIARHCKSSSIRYVALTRQVLSVCSMLGTPPKLRLVCH
eukprot:6265723-Amphidinium_carterae.1